MKGVIIADNHTLRAADPRFAAWSTLTHLESVNRAMWQTRMIYLALLILCCLAAGPVHGGDWPQILGPERNGKAQHERLLETWPGDGPQRLWKYALGSGYAGAAVAGERVVVFHRVGGSERVECLDAAKGHSLWKTDFQATYRGGIDRDIGPRCVPLIAGDTVFAFGAAGDLHAVALASGKRVWSRALYADYRGDEGY